MAGSRRGAVLGLIASIAGAATSAATSRTAFAQPQELQARAAAEQLFKDGADAMARRDYATACPKLEEVTRLLPGKIGAMNRLALCYEESGKVTSAWAEYRIIAATAPATDDLKRAAEEKVAALEPTLPRLVVVVSPAARSIAGLDVRRDGVSVGMAQWGERIPVDPGSHAVSAAAVGKTPWTASVAIARGATVVVEVPTLADAAAPLAPPIVAPPPPDAQATSAAGGPPTWAWVVGGIGVVAGVTGAVLAGLSVSGQNAIYASCGHGKPDDQATCDSLGRANDVKQGLAWGLGGVGIVGIGAAIIGIATAPKPKPAAAALRVTPEVSTRGGSLRVGGTF